LTVRETVALGFDAQLPIRSLAGKLLALQALRWQAADLGHRVDDLLDRLGLAGWRDHPLGELSTGTRRIVQLAIVMAQQPSVLLLDEPSAGLAAAELPALASVLRTVVDETGCATVLVEHDRWLVESLADDVVELHAGTVTPVSGAR